MYFVWPTEGDYTKKMTKLRILFILFLATKENETEFTVGRPLLPMNATKRVLAKNANKKNHLCTAIILC